MIVSYTMTLCQELYVKNQRQTAIIKYDSSKTRWHHLFIRQT